MPVVRTISLNSERFVRSLVSLSAVFFALLLANTPACRRSPHQSADAGADRPSGVGGGGTAGDLGALGGRGPGGAAGGDRGGEGGAGNAGGGGVGGGPRPSFACIDGWPTRPAVVEKTPPLSVEPGIVWTKSLPSTAPVVGMATSGSGVAVSSGSTLLIYDAIGTVIASLAKPQSRTISAPVTAADGRIFFADSTRVYAVDGTGQEVWQKALGTDQSGGMAAPLPPVLSSTGRLYVSALDGMLWTFRGEDGQVLANVPLGFLQESPRWIDAGVASVLFVDRSGISAAGPGVASEGIVEPDTGRWVGEIVVGAGMYHPGAFVGYDIGVVSAAYLDTTTETTETDVFDKCGNFRWRVPGDHAVPLAITFNDDLIVMDRSPIGGGKYTFALRRFSRDGALVAGPVAVPDTFCGRSFVGADDTFYYTGGASDGYRLRAFDSKLMQLWAVPFPHCPDAAVLNPDGKIFTARGPGAQFAAVQTTSPGPAPVSWGQTARDSHGSRWLSP